MSSWKPGTGRAGYPTKSASAPFVAVVEDLSHLPQLITLQESSKQPRTSPQYPVPLSFIFRIDGLYPNFPILGPQYDPSGFWIPPDHWNAYLETNGNLYCWTNGRITYASPANIGAGYSSATIFTHDPSTQHFYAVPFDARAKNVVNHDGWKRLGFHHVPLSENGPQYSELDFDPPGSEHHLVAPGFPNSAWVNELFTAQYRYNVNTDPNPPSVSAGLTGKLTLILGLVAFVRQPAELHTSLTAHVQPYQWLPYNLPSNGRTQYRGMVITIWLNKQSQTTAAELKNLEQGHYGPFFR